MSDELLTLDEYRALASDLRLPQQAFIDGGYRSAISGKTFTTINPATGETLTEVSACQAEDIDFAVSKARESFDDGRWRSLPPAERKAVIIKLAKLMKRNARELAVMESIDSGKTILDCETIDLPETINTLIWHAELIDKIYDQTTPLSDDHLGMVVREPIGVVGLVLPWNFPLLMLAWKIGPALAAGCSIVLKPAEETPLTALRVAELASEAGIPPGVLNVVPGNGPEAGEPLGRHMEVDMVSFTGSTETGRRFLTYSAESNLKEVVLEMGGKNPFVVLDDADNIDIIANHVLNGAFWNMGENCSASSRLIVHESVKPDLLESIIAQARDWRMGDPLDPANRIGSMVSKAHYDKVSSYLSAAEKDKLGTIVGGQSHDNNAIEPSIFDIDDDQHKLVREEIFGPVLSILTVSSNDQAIEMANDTSYGLAASVFSSNIKRAIRGARGIRAGTVTVNCYGEGDVCTPFCGFKQSGFGGRDKSIHAHDHYTALKTIWIDLSDDDIDNQVE